MKKFETILYYSGEDCYMRVFISEHPPILLYDKGNVMLIRLDNKKEFLFSTGGQICFTCEEKEV